MLTGMNDAPIDNDLAEGPANGRAFWCLAEDGLRLRVAHWRPAVECRGTILLFSGRSECVEKYGRTATELVAHGYAVLVMDWRGQGLSDRLVSDRMRGHVDAFPDYQKDAAALIRAARELDLPDPWHLLGHSMGACIGLRALNDGLPVVSCAFTAPMWGITMSPLQRVLAWPVSWGARLSGKAGNYLPDKTRQNRKSYVLTVGFEDNRLTQDADMFAYLVRLAENLPDRLIGGATFGWLNAALRECRALRSKTSPDIPALVFSAGQDEIVDNRVTAERMKHWSHARYEVVSDAMHDILSERPEIRNRVISEICHFFTRQAGAQNKAALPKG